MSMNDDFEMRIPELKLDSEEEMALVKTDSPNKDVLGDEDFTEEEIKQIHQFAERINLFDPNAIISYGSSAQQRLADFSDSAIDSVRTKDTNEIGDILSKMVADLKYNPEERKGFLGLFKKGANKLEDLKAHYTKIGNNVDAVSKVLKKHEFTLIKDVSLLEKLFQKNNLFYRELSMYIAAGKIALDKALNEELPKLNAKAAETGHPNDAQRARDFADMCDRFDKKLNDLAISRTICIQNAPQIRLVQNNDMLMADKIKSALVNVIPLWKSQMLLALGMAHSQDAIKAGNVVSNATNDLLRTNADILHDTTIAAAKENERNIVDIETLQHTNDRLISTLDELVQINAESRENRRTIEVELTKIETELRDKIREISANRENV